MTKEEASPKDIIVGAAGAATGSIAQAAALALGLGPGVEAGLAVFAGTIPAMIQYGFQRRAQRRCLLAAKGMEKAATEDVPPGELVESAETQETFLSMFYDLMDAVDDAAAPALGHIAMTYAKSNRGPDGFFRAFGRVVRELDANEISDLVNILTLCVRRVDLSLAAFSDSEVLRTNFRDPVGHTLEAGGVHDKEWEPVLQVGNGVRLLLLMKQHGLATEPTDVPGVFGGEPVRARIWVDTARLALRHLAAGSMEARSQGGD